MSLGIPLVTLNEKSKLDVAIDGADDVDRGLNLVKGGGGECLLPMSVLGFELQIALFSRRLLARLRCRCPAAREDGGGSLREVHLYRG